MALAPLPAGNEPALPPATPKRGLTRRQALAAAVATGVGVGAIRLLGGALQNLNQHTTAASSAAPGTDWVSPLGSESARVMQLLRRATFGYTPDRLESALSDGFDRTVDRLLETPPAEPPVLDAASTPGGRFAVGQLQVWWIDHMLSTPTPFAERMALFWHGHFTSDYRKTADNTFMYWQNLTWRRMAMTDLRSMLMKVTIDPAMLRYLDLATSVASSPNENYSRELMELFTMGAGNYTEDDVRQGALALTGWQLPRPDSTAPAPGTGRNLPVYSSQKTGVFNRRRAHSGDVTFLGHTGPLDTQGLIDRILAQPATAPFIATKVAQHFVTGQPSSSFIRRIADGFRRSKYDMKTLMRSVFTSPEFSSAASYRSLVKSPTEMMVHASFALGDGSLARLIAQSGSGMGQILFDPPDVGGWPNNEAWISSNTVIEHVNFVTNTLAHATSLPPSQDVPRQHLDGVVGEQTASLLNQATDEKTRWFVALASPEFQLK
ncbi:MAG TPA: DUF1800 domain-containing protein [Candidatus Dormibacteraeota bacterium]|nr:DUF1800 domain-containing protein [Candidatus Dormibacteraeota bacterium]